MLSHLIKSMDRALFLYCETLGLSYKWWRVSFGYSLSLVRVKYLNYIKKVVVFANAFLGFVLFILANLKRVLFV